MMDKIQKLAKERSDLIDRLMEVQKLAKERSDLIDRLMEALEHMPLARQYEVLTSHLSITELRELVAFQERDE